MRAPLEPPGSRPAGVPDGNINWEVWTDPEGRGARGTMLKREVEPGNYHRLLYPRQVVLVSFLDPRLGRPNIIPISWSIPLSFKPPQVGIAVEPRWHSYTAIREAGEFVVNVPAEGLLQKALLCGRSSGASVDKFAEASLTAKDAKRVKAPIIEECIAHMECLYRGEFRSGDHALLVGEVVEAYADGSKFDGSSYLPGRARLLFQLGADEFLGVPP